LLVGRLGLGAYLLLTACTATQANSDVEAGARLDDFLSGHNDARDAIEISVVPDPVYLEEGRGTIDLDFDLVVTNKTQRSLALRFVKVAVYDAQNRLLTYRFINHNGMNPSIRTLGRWKLEGEETIDIYNPFHSFPRGLDIRFMRYMLTFADEQTGQELYYGDLIVRPRRYVQRARLQLPLEGLVTVLDGHDYTSHHRRFSTTALRQSTGGQIVRNFSRYAVDLVPVGTDGNLRHGSAAELRRAYDFHVPDARAFYGYGADVFAPDDGTVVDVVNDLPDLLTQPFDIEAAIRDERLKDVAGNLVVIRHNGSEYSHLFHLQQGSVVVKKGQLVERGQLVGKIGFSGAATTYVHLHYQLMNGPDPLGSAALPFEFYDVAVVQGSRTTRFQHAMVDTGDLLLQR
jgi:murein DD-endopeptidase MepM/ murein hydrolase activator NlpD